MVDSYLQDIPKSRITSETIREMYRLADRGKTDPAFQKIVYGIVNGKMPGQWKNYRGEVEAVFSWFKRNHDYRRDPHDVELLQDVWATMDRKRFDCDDCSIFLCAACEILGAPCRFITVSTNPSKEPEHVYVECFVGGRWTALDASERSSFVGWAPQRGITDKIVWDRPSVGLASYDGLPVGGTGMGMNGREYEGGFATDRYQVESVPGLSPASYRWAHPMPGELVLSHRETPPPTLAPTADQERMAVPDNPEAAYPHELPTASALGPMERRTTNPGLPPMHFNPDVWTGRAPYMMAHRSEWFPQPVVGEEQMMADLAGLGGMGDIVGDIAAIAKDIFSNGQAPSVDEATKLAMDIYASGQAKPPAQRPVAPVASDASRWVVPGIVVAVIAAVGLSMGRKR